MVDFSVISNLFSTSALSKLADNFTKTDQEFDKVLYKDGSVAMSDDLDMNSSRLINLGDATSDSMAPNLGQVSNLISTIPKGDKGDRGALSDGFVNRASLQAATVAQNDGVYLLETGYVGKKIINLLSNVSQMATVAPAFALQLVSNPLLAAQTLFRGRIRAEEAGSQPDSDNTGPIQTAVDASLYSGQGGKSQPAWAEFPGGTSTLTSELYIGYGASAGFKGARVIGRGFAYGANGTTHVGTALISTVVDRPAISIQSARATSLEGFYIKGAGDNAINLVDKLAAGIEWHKEATWDAALLTAGIVAGRRYAPHALIAIDPRSGTRPATSYPDAAIPSWQANYTTQYGKPVSTMYLLRDFGVSGGEVGVVIQPCDINSNGDWPVTEGHTLIENVKFGWSVGTSQHRICGPQKYRFRGVHTCLTNTRHGKQSGRMGGDHHIAAAEYFYQLFEINSLAVTSAMRLNLNCEAGARLGVFTAGGSSASAPMEITGKFNAASSFDDTRGIPPKQLAGALERGPVHLTTLDYQFQGVAYLEPPGSQLDNVNVTNATRTNVTETKMKPYMKAALNALSGGILTNPTIAREGRVTFLPISLSGANLTPTTTDNNLKVTGRDTGIPWTQRVGMFSNGTSGYFTRSPSIYTLGMGQRSSATRVNRTVQFTCSALTGWDVAYERNLVPGSVLVGAGTGTAMFIRSSDPTTGIIIAEMMSNYYFDTTDSTYKVYNTAIVPGDTDFLTETWYALGAPTFAPPTRIFGTITSGSPIITNIYTYNGLAVPTTYGLAVGDHLAVTQYARRFFPTTSTSDVAKITAIDTTAATITMGVNAAFSATDVPLDLWQLPIANVTVRQDP